MEGCPHDPSDIREEVLTLFRKAEDRDREGYVQITQSLPEGKTYGTRGEADKDPIWLNMP